jgi:hypothetical protein
MIKCVLQRAHAAWPRTTVWIPAESKNRPRALKCLLRRIAQKQGQNGGVAAQKSRGSDLVLHRR